MRLTPILAAAVLTSSAILMAGCSAKPTSYEKVDQSVLPADVKGMLATDAQFGDVYREHYANGATMYKIHYTLEGQPQVIRVNAKTDTKAHGVFEDPVH